jgi:hypothetical protein
LAGNLVKPLLSLYGTEWRERGYGLSTWHQQQLIQLAAFLTPHTQWFISQLELTVSSQEYLKELRKLLFQRALYKLPSRDVLKKGNYYFFLYND